MLCQNLLCVRIFLAVILELIFFLKVADGATTGIIFYSLSFHCAEAPRVATILILKKALWEDFSLDLIEAQEDREAADHL